MVDPGPDLAHPRHRGPARPLDPLAPRPPSHPHPGHRRHRGAAPGLRDRVPPGPLRLVHDSIGSSCHSSSGASSGTSSTPSTGRRARPRVVVYDCASAARLHPLSPALPSLGDGSAALRGERGWRRRAPAARRTRRGGRRLLHRPCGAARHGAGPPRGQVPAPRVCGLPWIPSLRARLCPPRKAWRASSASLLPPASARASWSERPRTSPRRSPSAPRAPPRAVSSEALLVYLALCGDLVQRRGGEPMDPREPSAAHLPVPGFARGDHRLPAASTSTGEMLPSPTPSPTTAPWSSTAGAPVGSASTPSPAGSPTSTWSMPRASASARSRRITSIASMPRSLRDLPAGALGLPPRLPPALWPAGGRDRRLRRLLGPRSAAPGPMATCPETKSASPSLTFRKPGYRPRPGLPPLPRSPG